MGRVVLHVAGYKCDRCEHEWAPKKKGSPPLGSVPVANLPTGMSLAGGPRRRKTTDCPARASPEAFVASYLCAIFPRAELGFRTFVRPAALNSRSHTLCLITSLRR